MFFLFLEVTSVPFHKYYSKSKDDHFYTTNKHEVDASDDYTHLSVACHIYPTQVPGSLPFYRYFNGHNSFYTLYGTEIGATTPGDVGKFGYRSEGVAGYCYPQQEAGSIPLYRYYKHERTYDHYYTTDASDIGTTILGQVGRDGYKFEGVACYVPSKER